MSVEVCICSSSAIHRGRSVAYRKVLWATVEMAVDIYLEEEGPRGACLWSADIGRTAMGQRD